MAKTDNYGYILAFLYVLSLLLFLCAICLFLCGLNLVAFALGFDLIKFLPIGADALPTAYLVIGVLALFGSIALGIIGPMGHDYIKYTLLSLPGVFFWILFGLFGSPIAGSLLFNSLIIKTLLIIFSIPLLYHSLVIYLVPLFLSLPEIISSVKDSASLYILEPLISLYKLKLNPFYYPQQQQKGMEAVMLLAKEIDEAYSLGDGAVKNGTIVIPKETNLVDSYIEGKKLVLKVGPKELTASTKVDANGTWPTRIGPYVFSLTAYSDFVDITFQKIKKQS
jgi:hypothetical protein